MKQVGGVPRCVRGDRGTENVNICALQRFFRRDGTDPMAGEKSFLYGRSVSNQSRSKPGGLFYARMELIGGSIFLKI